MMIVKSNCIMHYDYSHTDSIAVQVYIQLELAASSCFHEQKNPFSAIGKVMTHLYQSNIHWLNKVVQLP